MNKGLIARSLLAIGIFTMFFSCKKAVDNAQKNALYDLVTQGRWEVTKFDVGTTPNLADYNGFEFQFYRNGTVTAYKSSESDVNGTWLGDEQKLTIQSNFPGVGVPLDRFNGLWFLTKATETTVEAFKTVGPIEYKLALKKKS